MRFNVPMPVRLVLAFLGPALAAGAGESGDWATLSTGQLVSMLLAGLMGAGALLAPSGKASTNDKAVASVQDVVAKTAEAHEKLTQQAVDSIGRVIESVGNLGALIPLPPGTPPVVMPPNEAWRQPLGPLAQQAMEVARGLGGARPSSAHQPPL